MALSTGEKAVLEVSLCLECQWMPSFFAYLSRRVLEPMRSPQVVYSLLFQSARHVVRLYCNRSLRFTGSLTPYYEPSSLSIVVSDTMTMIYLASHRKTSVRRSLYAAQVDVTVHIAPAPDM